MKKSIVIMLLMFLIFLTGCNSNLSYINLDKGVNKEINIIKTMYTTDTNGIKEDHFKSMYEETKINFVNNNIDASIDVGKMGGEYFYSFYSSYSIEDNEGFNIFSICDDYEKKWSVTLFFDVSYYFEINDHFYVYGNEFYNNQNRTESTYIAKITKTGTLLWTKEFLYTKEVKEIFENDDNSINVFLQGDNRVKNGTIMCTLDDKGDTVSEKNIPISYFDEVTKIENGYLIMDYPRCIYKLSKDGTLISCFKYNEYNKLYRFEHVIEYNGKIYISGCTYDTSTSIELQDIKEQIHRDKWIDFDMINNEYLLNLFNGYYEATLFICDFESGNVEKLYSVQSAIGSNLYVEEDKVIWEVEKFEAISYSPTTSSYQFEIVVSVYNFIFKNKINSVVKTDKLRYLRK